jgi:oxygen-independent coproporphyrinogen-3 oxidase
MYQVEIDKLIKYDKPGPRYTSYPTAPHFNEQFTPDDLLKEIRRTNEADNAPDLSLYFHLPFCNTLCYFCGCNMIITQNRDRIRLYTDYLKREIEVCSELIRDDRRIEQLHWGGGTPTHLNPAEIDSLITHIGEHFNFADDAEIGCEIDPRMLTREHLEALRNGGFNRISMGLQDFDEKVQKAINRIQPEDMTRQVCEWVKELGFLSMNIDLIYGLPLQTPESFADTIDRVIDISPERIAVFNYAHVPWLKKHMKLIKEDDLPAPELKLETLKMTIEKLTDSGYVFIGMDHFAKPGDELAVARKEKKLYRNFQGYSTHAGADLYAMGITSISQLPHVYSQNHKKEKEYFEAVDNGMLPVARGFTLNEDDIIRRKVVMNLMCHFSLNFNEIEEEFDITFKDYFAWGLKNLHEMEDDGLIAVDEKGIEITESGRLLIRNVAMNFDGYNERQVDTTKYSRTM